MFIFDKNVSYFWCLGVKGRKKRALKTFSCISISIRRKSFWAMKLSCRANDRREKRRRKNCFEKCRSSFFSHFTFKRKISYQKWIFLRALSNWKFVGLSEKRERKFKIQIFATFLHFLRISFFSSFSLFLLLLPKKAIKLRIYGNNIVNVERQAPRRVKKPREEEEERDRVAWKTEKFK